VVSSVSTTSRYRLVAPDRSVVVPKLDKHQQRVVDHEGGPLLVLVYAVCGFFAFLVLRALGELVLHRPSSGSFVSYAREFYGEKMAYVAGWMYFLNWAMTAIVDSTAVALYVKYWQLFSSVPQWLLAHEPLKLGNQLRVAPQRELGLDPLLERRQLLLFEPRSLGAGKGVAQLGQRRSTPQGQPFPEEQGGPSGLLHAGRRDQQLEAMEIELAVGDPDEIARGLRQDQIPAERLAQLGDVHLERRPGGVGR